MTDVIVKCQVCQNLIDEEDLFCANCGTEAPRREEEREKAGDFARVARHNFECSRCGASMSYDAEAEALRCPFCGSVDLRQKEDAKILAPHRVVPFQLGREEADSTMRRWLGRGFWRPGDLARQASVVKMAPVYVPYWVFEATTHTHWTADTSQTPLGARGDWCPLSGEHRGSYSGLLIGASGALTPGETAAICPFDLGAGKPPEEVDLENVTVEQFSRPRKYARPLARQGLEQSEAAACQARYVPGRARNVHANVRIESMSSEPVLLPVWIMAYRYRDKLFRFLINGQSGRATGQAPISLSKILVAAGIGVVAILLVLLLLAFLS
jgi:DNA-directed RNA polymerase subunit RPC12/RpoP